METKEETNKKYEEWKKKYASELKEEFLEHFHKEFESYCKRRFQAEVIMNNGNEEEVTNEKNNN